LENGTDVAGFALTRTNDAGAGEIDANVATYTGVIIPLASSTHCVHLIKSKSL